MKSYFYDTTKKILQVFELVASQLRGKLAVGDSSSYHHGETHTTIIFEYFDDWLYLFRHNKAYLNPLRNNQQSTSMKEKKEPPSSAGGEAKKTLHHEDRNSFPSYSIKDKETSHDNE